MSATDIQKPDKIFCFGEFLLRMSPALNKQWIEQASMPVYIGGAELNVATALAKWNIPVKYFSALPDNYLSHEIIEVLNEKNIDTSSIVLTGDRIGSYYLPQGTDLKNAGVIYDRANSSFASLKKGQIDWDKTFEGCSWFHFSAITPALSQQMADLTQEALSAAAKNGMFISVDLNYRSRLWKYDKSPLEIMYPLVKFVDLVMGNIWAAESLLDIKAPLKSSIGASQQQLIDACKKSFELIKETFPKAKTIAYTLRLDNVYSAVLSYQSAATVSREFSLAESIDKVGSGDCFMAGIIYGIIQKQSPNNIVNFAAAAAVGKLQEKGDSTNQTVSDVNKLMSDGQ